MLRKGRCLLAASRRRNLSRYRIKAERINNQQQNANQRKKSPELMEASVSPPSGHNTKPYQGSDGQCDKEGVKGHQTKHQLSPQRKKVVGLIPDLASFRIHVLLYPLGSVWVLQVLQCLLGSPCSLCLLDSSGSTPARFSLGSPCVCRVCSVFSPCLLGSLLLLPVSAGLSPVFTVFAWFS